MDNYILHELVESDCFSFRIRSNRLSHFCTNDLSSPPGKRIQPCRIFFYASNLGGTAFHSQINYHQVSGMFNVVASRSADLSWWDAAGFSDGSLLA
ncbi:hypothetical protein SynBIOSE41_01715 [Synechococcus sp. BIOS-E4-1]|nr:hypothetical protein SynBIOSE41_01715 [Synechococcus sp. BIOS-E4-1]